MTVALQMEGWKIAQPAKEMRLNNRILRMRDCNPPRLTTKVANNPPKKRKKR